MVFRAHAGATPGETVYHASLGASGMAGADMGSITASKHVRLVAVADVDLRNTAAIKKRFRDARVYQDWRELLDKETRLDSVNVWTLTICAPHHHECAPAGAERLPPKLLGGSSLPVRFTGRIGTDCRVARVGPR
jgi:hypothetical protein